MTIPIIFIITFDASKSILCVVGPYMALEAYIRVPIRVIFEDLP